MKESLVTTTNGKVLAVWCFLPALFPPTQLFCHLQRYTVKKRKAELGVESRLAKNMIHQLYTCSLVWVYLSMRLILVFCCCRK